LKVNFYLQFRLILFSSNNYDLNFKFRALNPHFVVNHLFNNPDFKKYLETPEKLIKSINDNQNDLNGSYPNNVVHLVKFFLLKSHLFFYCIN
jgi:hypothetical protein